MSLNSSNITIQERRHKPRINCQYAATVQGHDAMGKKFEESARLSNLSATGLYLLMNRSLEPGQKIFVIVRLTSELIKEATPRIATNGIVMRTEPQQDGVLGVAVKFQRYRFL